MVEYAVSTDKEFKGGPIWTQVEISTFTGARETSPDITNKDIIKAENIVWDVLEKFRDPKTGPGDRPEVPINFAGDISQRDIYCFTDRNIVMSCFIRHEEDFIGVKSLWKFAQELIDEVPDRMGDPFSVRNYKVIHESWVEQHHPEIVMDTDGHE